jgi:hypothetical protein
MLICWNNNLSIFLRAAVLCSYFSACKVGLINWIQGFCSTYWYSLRCICVYLCGFCESLLLFHFERILSYDYKVSRTFIMMIIMLPFTLEYIAQYYQSNLSIYRIAPVYWTLKAVDNIFFYIAQLFWFNTVVMWADCIHWEMGHE